MKAYLLVRDTTIKLLFSIENYTAFNLIHQSQIKPSFMERWSNLLIFMDQFQATIW